MDTPKAISIGPYRLTEEQAGLTVHHKALTNPLPIDPKQLERWLTKQVRAAIFSSSAVRA